MQVTATYNHQRARDQHHKLYFFILFLTLLSTEVALAFTNFMLASIVIVIRSSICVIWNQRKHRVIIIVSTWSKYPYIRSYSLFNFIFLCDLIVSAFVPPEYMPMSNIEHRNSDLLVRWYCPRLPQEFKLSKTIRVPECV